MSSVQIPTVGEWVDLELAAGWEPGPTPPKARINGTGVEFTGSAYSPSGSTFAPGTIASIPAGQGLLVAENDGGVYCPAAAAVHGVGPAITVTAMHANISEAEREISITHELDEEGVVFFNSLRYELV